MKLTIMEMPMSRRGRVNANFMIFMVDSERVRALVPWCFRYREADAHVVLVTRMIGAEDFVKEHTYSIIQMQGRMPSFSHFMEGKFVKFSTIPERVKSLVIIWTPCSTVGQMTPRKGIRGRPVQHKVVLMRLVVCA
jgi:hypothetical protein